MLVILYQSYTTFLTELILPTLKSSREGFISRVSPFDSEAKKLIKVGIANKNVCSIYLTCIKYSVFYK